MGDLKEKYESFKEQVRQAADIVSVVSETVDLKKKGRRFWGCCPFHSEKTPSFTVNPEKGFFHCFGCGAGGDVFTFVMKRDHVSFVEAERILANKYGIPIPEPEKTAEEIRREQEEKEIVGTNELAARFFHACLTKTQYGKEGLTYLASRGIGMDIVESFELGLAPPDAQTFHKALEKRGIPEKTLLKAGLIGQSDSGRIYDKFRERIMIPIKNPRGKVVGFTGRILRKEASPAKYMNTPETSWFHKGRLLFGMDRALPSIRKRRQALIVEGHMDAISLHAAGITWAVASMGTAFTEYQAKLLKRVTPEVIFCFDSDNAGRNAAMRSIPIALAVGLECRVMHVTDGKDPDEFIRKDGQEAFLSLLDQAKGGIDYEVDTVLSRSDVTTLSGKVGAVSEILPFFKDCRSDVEVGERIREVGHEYGTTTGRPRRVGWFDSVVMRHSRRVSGITNLSLNCIDVLSGLDTVKICVAYDLDGERIDYYPASLEQLKRGKPIYEELPGWSEDITGVRHLDELPENARNYVRRVSELVGVRISTFSVGPGREQTNILESVWSSL